MSKPAKPLSKIEWTDFTFNPWRGCEKISAGCANCYAEKGAKRNPKVLGEWGHDANRVIASEAYWRIPIRMNEEAKDAAVAPKIFCASFADICEDRRDLVAPRGRLKDMIDATPYLDWLLLTKRPENYVEMFWGKGVWPKNVWAGTTVEHMATYRRVDEIMAIQCRVRFLSVEPMLGPVTLRADHVDSEEGRVIDWIIVGGESGARDKIRAMNIAWTRDLVNQCKRSGVPVFVKQLGADPFYEDRNLSSAPKTRLNLLHPKGAETMEWPEDLRVREFPRIQN